MKILLYHQHLQRTTELIEGRLLLLDSAPSILNTYIATSGLPNNQRFDCLSSPGRGPIPQNSIVGIDCYSVVTKPIYMPGVKGVEGNFYQISPHEVTINGVERGDFGVHFDANVPGSSGCVVLRTNEGWQAFEKDMQGLLTSGVKEIPLLVSYSR
jgi:hypothetical protein